MGDIEKLVDELIDAADTAAEIASSGAPDREIVFSDKCVKAARTALLDAVRTALLRSEQERSEEARDQDVRALLYEFAGWLSANVPGSPDLAVALMPAMNHPVDRFLSKRAAIDAAMAKGDSK